MKICNSHLFMRVFSWKLFSSAFALVSSLF